MQNRWRGEVALVIDGQKHLAKLTLGALAELEEDLGETTLMALVERFEGNNYSARDVLALLAAGLRGGGAEIDLSQLEHADIEGGPMAATRAAAQLLTYAFMVPE